MSPQQQSARTVMNVRVRSPQRQAPPRGQITSPHTWLRNHHPYIATNEACAHLIRDCRATGVIGPTRQAVAWQERVTDDSQSLLLISHGQVVSARDERHVWTSSWLTAGLPNGWAEGSCTSGDFTQRAPISRRAPVRRRCTWFRGHTVLRADEAREQGFRAFAYPWRPLGDRARSLNRGRSSGRGLWP